MKKLTTEEFKEKLNAKYSGEYEVLSEYTTSKGKITVKHIPCGTVFSPTAKDLLAGDSRCPTCFKSKLKLNLKSATDRLTTEKVIENLKKKYPGKEFQALSEYKGYNEPFKILCDGVEFNSTMHVYANKFKFTQKHPKPEKIVKPKKAKTDSSKKQTPKPKTVAPLPKVIVTDKDYLAEVFDYVKSIYPEPEKSIVPDYTTENGIHLDIYVPEKKLGINCNTLSGASEAYLGKNGRKRNMMALHDIGIRVVNMFSDEWFTHKDITKDKLAAILHCPQKKTVYARICTIRDDIDPSEKNEFLDKYHIQGHDSSSIKCGLYDGNELVAIMTFGKERKCLGARVPNGYELLRFAAKYNVVGGFSKLLKHAIAKYQFGSLKTYADARWSSLDKNVYSQNGFECEKICDPGYWYFKEETKRIHRYNFRKQELGNKFPDVYSPNLTEFQIMDKTEYRRVWDCGNMVFKYLLNK